MRYALVVLCSYLVIGGAGAASPDSAGQGGAVVDLEKLAPALGTVAGALIAAFLGSLLGAKAALSRFKDERAFEKRLAWYEDVARTLAETKLSIEVARTFEEDSGESAEAKSHEWGKVQGRFIELVQVEALAVLYAPPDVRRKLQALREWCDGIADRTNGWDVRVLPKHLDELNAFIEEIDRTMLVHAATVRRALRFEPLAAAPDPEANDEVPVVNQSGDDVQLVRAAIESSFTVDTGHCCEAADADTYDCTLALEHAAGAPSLEQVSVLAGATFDGCHVLRVITATRATALPAALGIGFYSADSPAGGLGANLGRLVPSDALQKFGDAHLKDGQPAVLHEFAALVNCEGARAVDKVLKPYIDFVAEYPEVIYRNWDATPGNYALSGRTPLLDRSAQVLR
jgi:hypothetical protein